VEFIRLFTRPKINNDELWRINDTPFITIHLSMKKKKRPKKEDKKKGDKKKDKKDTKHLKVDDDLSGAASAAESDMQGDDDNKNKVIYKPTLEEC